MKTTEQLQKEEMVKQAMEVAQIACSEPTTNYVDYDRRIWQAFEHGRAYQKAVSILNVAKESQEK